MLSGAKRSLSFSTHATIEIDALFERVDYSYRISRERFEEICMDYWQKALWPIERCLEDSGMTLENVQDAQLISLVYQFRP